ncbi:MAG TPA: MBL fold metallo-hydrolase [Methanoregulaceae archaeon]|nr:MBL fold metallo-hydrolase [Methanoregulaceae archaeon]
MRATVIVDNTALYDGPLRAEHGYAILIEADGKKVLFDTGSSDLVVRNSGRLGIDLFDLDAIVLSHGHSDHTGGLYHLLRLYIEAAMEGTAHRLPRLVGHPLCLRPRPRPPLADIGPLLDEEVVRRVLPVEFTTGPLPLTPNLVCLGEIERRFPFEAFDPGARRIVMPGGRVEPDGLIDDTSLAYRSPAGLVVVTGCAHAGICNTVEYARRCCGEERVADIIGGLHLREDGEQLRGTCDYLRGLSLSALHACHCTSLLAKVALARVAPLAETGVGLRLEYPDRHSETGAPFSG